MGHKRVVLAAVLLAGAVLALSAQTAGVAESLRAQGYTMENPRTDGGRPTWDVRHQEGIPFTLSMIGPLTEARVTALRAIREVVFALDGLDIRRTRVVFDEDRAAVVVVPRSYRIAGREYSGYMPSGMQFVFDGALAFDFRMLSDNLALRVNGQYLTEEQFTERIVRAIANPAAYIESSDPQFLARRLEEQQALLDSVRSTNIVQDQAIGALRATDDQILAAIEEYVRIGESVLTREIRRVERAERQLRDDFQQDLQATVETLRSEMSQAFAGLQADHAALLDQHRELRVEVEALREGSIALAGRKLFGSLRELNPDAVARVVELRRSNPALEAGDVLSTVNGELPEGAEPLHNRHVQAIYAIYFNDYE